MVQKARPCKGFLLTSTWSSESIMQIEAGFADSKKWKSALHNPPAL